MITTRRSRRTVLLAAGLWVLASCGGEEGGPSAPGGEAGADPDFPGLDTPVLSSRMEPLLASFTAVKQAAPGAAANLARPAGGGDFVAALRDAPDAAKRVEKIVRAQGFPGPSWYAGCWDRVHAALEDLARADEAAGEMSGHVRRAEQIEGILRSPAARGLEPEDYRRMQQEWVRHSEEAKRLRKGIKPKVPAPDYEAVKARRGEIEAALR